LARLEASADLDEVDADGGSGVAVGDVVVGAVDVREDDIEGNWIRWTVEIATATGAEGGWSGNCRR
jgi:hypothetical protein